MNQCIKRMSGGVMRISDYWLLEVVQQCKWILKETDSNRLYFLKFTKYSIFEKSNVFKQILVISCRARIPFRAQSQ